MLNLIEDKKSKSKSFFLRTKVIFFSKVYVNFLINFYNKNKSSVRICLHQNSKAKHHDMVILQTKKNRVRTHKHLKKGETYNVIRGSMYVFLFKNSSKVSEKILLKKNDIFRVPANIFHKTESVSDFVIFHESKIGPFLKKNDSIYAKWDK